MLDLIGFYAGEVDQTPQTFKNQLILSTIKNRKEDIDDVVL